MDSNEFSKSRRIIVPDCLGIAKGLQSGVGLDDLVFQGALAWGLVLLAAVPNGSNDSKILNDPLGVDSLTSSGFSTVVTGKGSIGKNTAAYDQQTSSEEGTPSLLERGQSHREVGREWHRGSSEQAGKMPQENGLNQMGGLFWKSKWRLRDEGRVRRQTGEGSKRENRER